MSRAEGLRIWLYHFRSFKGGARLDEAQKELLIAALEIAIADIETLEQPARLDALNAKIAQAQAVMRHADAVVAASKSGKLSVLAAYRQRKGQGGRA